MKLSQLVDAIGWELVVVKHPHRHPDRVGSFNGDRARALTGNRIACEEDSMLRVYEVSHEISEVVERFGGHERVFQTQANLLTAWMRLLAGHPGRCKLLAEICDVDYTAEDEAKRRAKEARRKRRRDR